jgi:hypothetical protein
MAFFTKHIRNEAFRELIACREQFPSERTILFFHKGSNTVRSMGEDEYQQQSQLFTSRDWYIGHTVTKQFGQYSFNLDVWQTADESKLPSCDEIAISCFGYLVSGLVYARLIIQ